MLWKHAERHSWQKAAEAGRPSLQARKTTLRFLKCIVCNQGTWSEPSATYLNFTIAKLAATAMAIKANTGTTMTAINVPNASALTSIHLSPWNPQSGSSGGNRPLGVYHSVSLTGRKVNVLFGLSKSCMSWMASWNNYPNWWKISKIAQMDFDKTAHIVVDHVFVLEMSLLSRRMF